MGGDQMEDFLMHYGVLGMKWGRRKARPSRSSKPSTQRTSSLSKKATTKKKATKKVKVKDLSDEDLQKKINRLQMEKRYRDLKKDEVSAGRKLVGDILMTSGKTVGVQVVNYAAAKIINKALHDEVVKTGKSKEKKKEAS